MKIAAHEIVNPFSYKRCTNLLDDNITLLFMKLIVS